MGKRLDEIASRHRPCKIPYYDEHEIVCDECSVGDFEIPWPCDAAVLLMHIARREQVQEPGTEDDHAD